MSTPIRPFHGRMGFKAFPQSRLFTKAESSRSSSVLSQQPRWSAFSTHSFRPRRNYWLSGGDEESLRAALDLEPRHGDAAVQLARILHGRGQDQEALEILENVRGSFGADGLSARIRLERSGVPDLSRAFAALDAGDNEQALDVLIESITLARSSRYEIRRVIVGILDELGLDHPITTTSRRRLASALY